MTASVDPRFVLAVPSKGRLQENATQFFARAGMVLTQPGGVRDYRGTLPGFSSLEIAFLPAAEIVAALAEGQAHLGVAGEDLLREAVPDADRRVDVPGAARLRQCRRRGGRAARLDRRAHHGGPRGCGGACSTARRGRRMRVATKYVNLTRGFFASRGVVDYRIVESLGATEGAPAAGGAELIVDITTTGATLAANALKVLDDGVILRSEANLVASLRADWCEAHRRTARAILGRIAAEEEAPDLARSPGSDRRPGPGPCRRGARALRRAPRRSGGGAARVSIAPRPACRTCRTG